MKHTLTSTNVQLVQLEQSEQPPRARAPTVLRLDDPPIERRCHVPQRHPASGVSRQRRFPNKPSTKKVEND